MSSGKVLLGVLTGAAVGAALGILFAPDKGTETRRKIAEKSNEYADGLGDKFTEFVEAMTQKFESLRDQALHIVENGKQTAQELEEEFTSPTKQTY
jgi:gas vesicle protein